MNIATLICTVGTSLLRPNLLGLPNAADYEKWLSRQPDADRAQYSPSWVQALRQAVQDQDGSAIAAHLSTLSPTSRLCGAEINSVYDLIQRDYCISDVRLILCYSATEDGRVISQILSQYFQHQGHQVELKEIEDLQDADPKRFRTKGLRNLVKTIAKQVRAYGEDTLAINATGGYKAQVAIAVLMGQALGVNVYYKHERFSEIIAFPPMPIALDFGLWMEYNHWFKMLEDRSEVLSWTELEKAGATDDWDERLEALIERVEVDNSEILLELSTVGQIFHERFRTEFDLAKSSLLPAAIAPNEKKPAKLTEHGWGGADKRIRPYMQRVIDEASYVSTCVTRYWNPGLSQPNHFRLSGDVIEGIYSDGSWTVKFQVFTSAESVEQKRAVVSDLNAIMTG